MKEVVIIGSGNLAEALARAVAGSATLHLRQIWARNAARGEAISRLTGVPRSSDPDRLAQAECYLLAVSDRAVGEVAERLPISAGAAVVHTAGAVPMDALPFARRGVLYPLQTFTTGREVDFRRVPLFVEASSPALLAELEEVAGALSNTVLWAGSAERARLHLAAVFVCNFVNHLYALGAEALAPTGLPFDVLKPLIRETAEKALAAASPAEAQTGPAVRGDRETLRRHLEIIGGDARLKTIYELLSEDIWEISKKTSHAPKP